jgi:hypothetical protein
MSSADAGRSGPQGWADDAALSRLHRALAREDTPQALDVAILAGVRARAASVERVAVRDVAAVPASDPELSGLHAGLAAHDTDPSLDQAILARARQPRPPAADGERDDVDALAELHRTHSTEDTPAELDRRVLDLAAARARNRPAAISLRRYRVPLALAAALVIGLALARMSALFMPEQTGPNVELLGGSAQRGADQWLEEIRALVRAQRLDDARQELARFSARYPAHAIPDDLAALQAARPDPR